ncbi:MAG: hypothetical protein K9G67_03930 [Bacteroidales bacterium]|nr:hypothetical protein [Bacteroidales bacterium]MCF8343379.1 hypothetical protein [Bacteroidales bacterium]MCF8350475.1 hypothetical protein [Bacteroidales bacterium]MCF8375480.1 hypothetical protein [Bacteroidales bacterium]MCF8399879.1 hypothetical protein [Bacteroidales bacterium]
MKNLSVINLLILLVTLLILSSCASYKYSNKRKGEQIRMTIKEEQHMFDLRRLEAQEIPGPKSRGIMIGDMISLAAEGVKLLIEADKKKYTGEYTWGLSELYFYDRISDVSPFDVSGMQFGGFSLLRTAEVEKEVQDTAFFISFKIVKENPYEIFNNAAFRLEVEDFVMKYAKAKIPVFKWYMPWTIFYKKKTTINLDMKITFTATWSGLNSDVNRDREIGSFYLNLREVPLGDAEKFKAYKEELTGTQLYGGSFIVPRSYGVHLDEQKNFQAVYGRGLYDILVEVTESGKDHFVTKVVQDNSERIVDEVKSGLINQLGQ